VNFALFPHGQVVGSASQAVFASYTAATALDVTSVVSTGTAFTGTAIAGTVAAAAPSTSTLLSAEVGSAQRMQVRVSRASLARSPLPSPVVCTRRVSCLLCAPLLLRVGSRSWPTAD
jgi:hypothetical protein